MKAVQFRVARPTNQMDKLITFYEQGLGLSVGEFHDHNGYDGIMFGIHGTPYHVEFTSHKDGSPCIAQTKDQLLVFYIEELRDIVSITARMKNIGYDPCTPENPYWEDKGITFEDDHGFRVVLINTGGLSY
ncbi:hypothetical protein Q73_14455 [Bacillus coahuilensis m2-6]|uniref:VOC family protein n=1 Tax=Bacillus coahuilensis TaxID=408580 RepID=UPI0007504BBC|nr:VOC family protein [Bacillus coahuilensis]KUP04830.1 hypothetical protein Q73_14455 [Bacillus coahuilensis m2-6]